ncbi:MAG TPA: hypothetical protein VMY35_19145 [Phycisphaerae bacterium]|nr:hypothetical protein [Phycisphaerae bacterium]
MNRMDEMQALRRLIGDMERRLKAVEHPAPKGPLGELLERCASGKGRVLPPPENALGPASELFSQVVPRNIGGGDGGAGAGGAGGGAGPEYDADETYISEDAPAPGAPVAPHVFQHMAIGDQPAPDRGNDFVRSATGHHITHTAGAHMVNPAGHIDPSKAGASVKHAAPDLDENETDVGAADVTSTDPRTDTTTVDGTNGMSLTELTRLALDASGSGGPNLYAFFRKWLQDYNGHFTVVEVESAAMKVFGLADDPGLEFDGVNSLRVKADASKAIQRSAGGVGLVDGTADKQMLAWDHDPGEWDKILPDGTWIDVDLTTGKLKHIGPGAGCYSMAVCGTIYTDELGHVRCWTNGILSCGPCT